MRISDWSSDVCSSDLLITEHGLINLDFADVKAIMSNAGSALMGIGRASGDNRAVLAAQQAIESPLIDVSIDGARGVLFSVTGGYDMRSEEHTSELQSLMRISYAAFCLKNTKQRL